MSVTVKQRRKGGPHYVYICHNGNEKWVNVGRKEAAERMATEIEVKLAMADLGFLKPKRKAHTFREAANIFLIEFQSKVDKGKKCSSTYERYSGVLNNFLLPRLGKVDVSTISKQDIFDLLNKGYSSSKVEINLIILNNVFVQARWQGWLEGNPLQDVRKKLDISRGTQKGFDIFTTKEVEKILATCGNNMFFLMAFRTGMRLGELLALEWSDIDMEKGVINIDKSFRAGVLGKPKTANGYRSIPMTDMLKRVVEKQWKVAKAASFKAGTGRPVLLFQDKAGKHLSQNTVRFRWKTLLKKSDVEYRKFHSIRHTFVSLLLAAGVLPIEVCKLAGHHKPSFTIDRYGHVLPGKESPLNVLEQANE